MTMKSAPLIPSSQIFYTSASSKINTLIMQVNKLINLKNNSTNKNDPQLTTQQVCRACFANHSNQSVFFATFQNATLFQLVKVHNYYYIKQISFCSQSLHICPHHLKSLPPMSLTIPKCSQSKLFTASSETFNQSLADKSPHQLNTFQHQISHRHKSTYSILYAHHTFNNQTKAPDKPLTYSPYIMCLAPIQPVTHSQKTFSQSGKIELINRSFTCTRCKYRPTFLNTHQHSSASVVDNLFTKELSNLIDRLYRCNILKHSWTKACLQLIPL